jgi:Fe2+ or Zn2+ uptake regulation protein
MTLPTLILACRAHGLAEIDRLADVAEAQADAALRQRLSGYRLTPRQMDVAVAIARALSVDGLAPTFREMAKSMGCSFVTVYEHVRALKKKGVLSEFRNAARAMRFAPGVLAIPS